MSDASPGSKSASAEANNAALASAESAETSAPAPPAEGAGPYDGASPILLQPAAAKRANATVIGMLVAVLLCLVLALPLAFFTAKPAGQSYRPAVDVSAAAIDAKGVAGFIPVAPALPSGWTVNYARWNPAGSDGVAFWEVGYVTAAQQFIVLTQTAQPNPTWLAGRTDNANVTGDRPEQGTSWELRDKPGTSTSLILTNKTTVVLRGEFSNGAVPLNDLDQLAVAVVNSLNGAAGK
ncbi:DUF4245 domain-containing protein [Psychromicrobium lacuslunae]|uniref:DUF4245 domain-containing protein n=1 Tax=Psychromicrobium lacuslunae TaxID=1618207 RepID=A0A0D4BVR8_9MICC|nr:DUF4245 domain-containing protein [Psychromicrobium lacuslunae]AJT40413.1 hypothetical protein UM93_00520 [Psychromicrobium lacuslunae]